MNWRNIDHEKYNLKVASWHWKEIIQQLFENEEDEVKLLHLSKKLEHYFKYFWKKLIKHWGIDFLQELDEELIVWKI